MDTVTGEHIPENDLERYSMGQIGEEDAAFLEQHLLICAECQDRLQEMDEFVLAMRRASLDLLNQPPGLLERVRSRLASFWSAWTSVYALAAAAAVLTVVVLIPRQTTGVQEAEEVVLTSARGAERAGGSVARAGRPLHLHLDLAAMPAGAPYRVDIVNSAGRVVWFGSGEPQQGRLGVSPNRTLAAGQYWVRLYGAGAPDRLLREFGLQVR